MAVKSGFSSGKKPLECALSVYRKFFRKGTKTVFIDSRSLSSSPNQVAGSWSHVEEALVGGPEANP